MFKWEDLIFLVNQLRSTQDFCEPPLKFELYLLKTNASVFYVMAPRLQFLTL